MTDSKPQAAIDRANEKGFKVVIYNHRPVGIIRPRN